MPTVYIKNTRNRIVPVPKELAKKMLEKDGYELVNDNKEEKDEDKRFLCPVCGKTHWLTSKIGQEHFPDNKSSSLKEVAIDNLSMFKDIMDDLDIPFWLDGGTLLGAYRDGDFPEGDEDDIDLGTWSWYKHLIPKIIEECKKKGFELYHHWDANGKAHEISFKRDKSKIDLFFFERKGHNVYWCLYKNDNYIPVVFDEHLFENFKKIKFYDIDFYMPEKIEEYLEVKYGDWKKRISADKYREMGGAYNPHNHKSVKLDYEI